jgi:hypothetical protein
VAASGVARGFDYTVNLTTALNWSFIPESLLTPTIQIT